MSNLTYNDNGSVISYTKNGNTFNFIYNPLERISEVDLNGSLLSKYIYDPVGERVKKEIYSNGALSETVIYFYGQEGLLAEYDENMNLIKKYIYNPDRPWGTDPLYQEDASGNKYYYINDHLFTPQKMVDENLNTVWQGDWQSFGSVNELVNTVENNLRFPGQYYDSETGFYYNFHRYYEPDVGRYLREDEKRTFLSLNYYFYVNNKPLNMYDFNGKFPYGEYADHSISKVLADFFNLNLSENYGHGWTIQRHGYGSIFSSSGILLWAVVCKIRPGGCREGTHPAWAVSYNGNVNTKHFDFNLEYLKFKCRGDFFYDFGYYFTSENFPTFLPLGFTFLGECCERKPCFKRRKDNEKKNCD